MIKVKFIYGNNKFEKIYNGKNELIINILLNYSSMINKNINELYFIYKGKKLPYNKTETISNLQNNNIVIIIINLNKSKENKDINQIICPGCKELAIINFDEDKMLINNCINKHNYFNISINEFMEKQIIREIKCNACQNDKYLYNDKFYICTCNQYICPLCIKSHDQAHKMIEYSDRFDRCANHNNNFISYCYTVFPIFDLMILISERIYRLLI